MSIIVEAHQAEVEAAYRAGLKEGIRRYAVWKDGKQVVGVLQKPLQEVLDATDKEKTPYDAERF